ncbi:hypothetical protein EJP82_17750 [Paenibacillus anaericanus]|uniref:Uncharacterized protein n=1 Tax=Paenibacillus anaericanus TaxID=170367 RepID=A0A433Y691_9BACL|nr:hypothetical protein [Paenibacillus anaericanus]RUT44461.1 hypothetical protein EJP82_17750 [Paenibacillus anaericanus]
MKAIVVLSLLLVLMGCSGGLNSKDEPISPNATNSTNELKQPIGIETTDVTFNDFIVPSEYQLKRNLSHSDIDATYRLYEFEVGNSLQEIEDWIRSESSRLGGEIMERYTFDTKSEESMDLIVLLPSKVGTRIISTYTPRYMDKKHLVIEETLIKQPRTIDQNYEDHALVIYTPTENGLIKESFKGNYYHQHTDIFSVYFYTQAFFQELIEVNKYNLELKYDMTKDELDYTVGYFDKEGNEMDPYDITDENRDEFTFGIQLKKDFLPRDETQRELILFNWAKTVLIGDKADSRVYEGSEKVNFLSAGKVFKSFTLYELVT